MKKVLSLFLCLLSVSVFGGLSVTLENDILFGSDDDYTHGTEVSWADNGDGVSSACRIYGVNQLMYTPIDITVTTNQPGDREYCGTASVFYETVFERERDTVRERWEVGVLGPSAKCEQTQTWVHQKTGSRTPRGWEFQMPDEPMFNYYRETRHPVFRGGKKEGWGFTGEAVYGGTLGTAFVNVRGGMSISAGWNVPRSYIPGGIEPKGSRSKWFSCLFGEMCGMLVLHNATLSDSLFRDREAGQEQRLEPMVCVTRYGLSAGYKALSVTYMVNRRSAEYKGQPKDTEWGQITVEWSERF